MKVVQIDINYQKSSTGKIVEQIHNNLLDEGFDSYVFYGRGEKNKDKNVYKFSYNVETYFHALMTRLIGLTGFFSFFSTRRLIKKIKKINPDIVQIHELHAYFVNYGKLLKFLAKKKYRVYFTFHCEFMYTGKCGHAHDCNKWKTSCGKCPLLKDYPKSLFFDFTHFMHEHKKKIFKNFDNMTIITPSNWLMGRVQESFLANFQQKVIHNGIDHSKFPYMYEEKEGLREELNIPKDASVVLTLGPNIFTDAKGGRNLIEIASLLKDKDIYYIIVGADYSKHNENIIILEKTSNLETLSAYYSLSDLFFIGSKRENFPTTALEALSHGTPIIGYDSGGTKETAPHPYGAFFKYGNNGEIAEFIKKYKKDRTLLANKEQCLNFALQEYTNEVMVKNYLNLYKEGDSR